MAKLNAEQTIKIAVEQMLEGIQIIDREWRYTYLNEAAALHGRTGKSSLIGRTMMECYPGIEKTEMFADLEKVMENGTPRRRENEFIFEDGRKCWFEIFIEPSPHGILIRSFDITERKQLQQQLWHSQKMEAVGLLAGGVAHDFNNKLAIMMAYCEITRDRIRNGQADKDQVIASLEKMLSAVQQAASLTRQLLAFSRKQILDLKLVVLNSLFTDLRGSLTKLIGENIRIDFRLAGDLGGTMVDPAQIEQVILNLCLNARDAMPEGGVLQIETKNVELDAEYAALHPEVIPGSYVMLAISDTGNGMDRATQERIFEPFFTTKPRGKGTGLGLSSVHGIVKQSRGHIWVYSEPKLGTVFKTYFPRVKAEQGQAFRPPRESPIVGGHEGILLVEDDALLREAYETALRGAGYRVWVAANGEDAEKLFAEHGEGIALLLTDLILPRGSGRALSAKLQARSPGLKTAFMSGYTENSVVHHGILDTESVLMQKPISLKNLLETARGVLDGRLKKGLVS